MSSREYVTLNLHEDSTYRTKKSLNFTRVRLNELSIIHIQLIISYDIK